LTVFTEKIYRFYEEFDNDQKDEKPTSAPKLRTRRSSLHPETGETLIEYFKEHPNKKWVVGITVGAIPGVDAANFMVVVLETLQAFRNVEWTLSTAPKEEYKVQLQIHHVSGSGSDQENPKQRKLSPVAANLQLYQSYRDHSFLVDIHRVSGDPFLFMTTVNTIEGLLRQYVKEFE
jgi:hypothetical protein